MNKADNNKGYGPSYMVTLGKTVAYSSNINLTHYTSIKRG